MPNMSKKIGKEAEDKGVEYLKSKGLKIVERNYYSRFGEIDIIAQSKDILHFIEVKATKNDYDPLYRITQKKIEKIVKTINFFILKNNIETDFQIDALVIKDNEIEWIKNINY